jgi:protein gp37
MGANSKIEWTDHTWNPWIGCTKVSPGCAHCYAEGESKRRGWAQWGKGKERHRTSANYWKQPLAWNAKAEVRIKKDERRRRVFCASLADWLDDEVPIEWFIDLLYLIDQTPNLDWLLLTKRPENFEPRMQEALSALGHCGGWIDGFAPENVWIGTSVEDQKRADERIPLLLGIPAKIRFLSCEPLLAQVTLTMLHYDGITNVNALEGRHGVIQPMRGECAKVDWVIVGGESGPGARPCNVEWIRGIVAQCKAASTPVFVKQLGANIRVLNKAFGFIDTVKLHDRKGGDPSEWPADLRLREFPKRSRRAADNNMLASSV